eukprot:TRINITY_DN1994_c1_g2_i1.p1 TRINITY_DN1994_c1_g2~~TRINITY_DN1994_c1_g2_i1.p1  ORF type:complete len:106 (-),score=5.26 TRINITY_DN1994_c1_g2_i1:57-374(-)
MALTIPCTCMHPTSSCSSVLRQPAFDLVSHVFSIRQHPLPPISHFSLCSQFSFLYPNNLNSSQISWRMNSSKRGCFSPLSNLFCRFCTFLFRTLSDFLLTGVGDI